MFAESIKLARTLFAGLFLIAAGARSEPPMPVEKAAALFGSRPAILSASLSPDGKRVVYFGAGEKAITAIVVIDVAASKAEPVSYVDRPFQLSQCGWASNDRIACTSYALDWLYGKRISYSRAIAFDADGRNAKSLSNRQTGEALRPSQYDGEVVDWLDGGTPEILMMRDHVAENTTGTHIGNTRDGYAVDRVDTRTLRARTIEQPIANVTTYLSDGQGAVRIMGQQGADSESGQLKGWTDYRYRTADNRTWRPFSHVLTQMVATNDFVPVAVDGGANAAYALKTLDGRTALYRVALDGSLKSELVYANPTVDVDGVVTIGRRGRVIGAAYTTDRRQVDYFDPAYAKLSAALGKAIPKLPLITFESASADESVLLVRASSDTDGGRLFIFDKPSHKLSELLPVRPGLEHERTAAVRSITYAAADGTIVPAYLTLPPGSDGKHLPAIVMPHGGPGARDEWGFDWLAQFFAARGYAVIQPQFRGSTGFGDAWYVDNGFKSWRIAVRDVIAAGEWLVKQGIADPAKLAIVGWSYGGYAALQANVLDPDLFKAVVAIAPVTDLRMLRSQYEGFTSEMLAKAFIGTGPHLTEGSPVLHATDFKAPVLLFHGDRDINVAIGESDAMDAALRRAGKRSQFVRYPGYDHQLDDSAIRADMLTKADAFLRDAMKM